MKNEKYIPADTAVLILGETGTRKNLIVAAIHLTFHTLRPIRSDDEFAIMKVGVVLINTVGNIASFTEGEPENVITAKRRQAGSLDR